MTNINIVEGIDITITDKRKGEITIKGNVINIHKNDIDGGYDIQLDSGYEVFIGNC